MLPSYISQGFDCCSRSAACAMRQYCSQKHPLYVIRVHVSENRFFSFGSNRTLAAWTLTQYSLFKEKKCGVWGQETLLSYVTWAGKSASTKPNLPEEEAGSSGHYSIKCTICREESEITGDTQWVAVHFCLHSSTWNKASVGYTCNRVKLKFKLPPRNPEADSNKKALTEL